MSHPCRLGVDGLPAVDAKVNEKAVARHKLAADSGVAQEPKALTRELIQGIIAHAIAEMHTINLHGADLSGLDLSGLDLSRANMHGVKAIGANFSGCRLVGTNLQGALLTGAILEMVNAVEANLSHACLCAVRASKTHFMGANLSNACCEGSDGIDVEDKPLTPAEAAVARRRQENGLIAHVNTNGGVVRYFGDTLKGAQVADISMKCRRVK